MEKPAQQVVNVEAESVLAVPVVVETLETPAQQLVTVKQDCIVGQLPALPEPMVKIVMQVVTVEAESVLAVPAVVETLETPAQQLVTVKQDCFVGQLPALPEPMVKIVMQLLIVQADSVLTVHVEVEPMEKCA